MNKHDQLDFILKRKLIAVVRSQEPDRLVAVAQALLEGGIAIIEITMTVPDALTVIASVRKEMGERILLGAGTVLDSETARSAMLAGANFVVSPILDARTIKLCRRHDTIVMPGAYTPTEILRAHDAGADIVKVFPADIGGPAFFRAVLAPMPFLKLMPTGGVDQTTAAEFLRAGVCCLGVGSSLVDKKLIAAGDMNAITERARRFAHIVANT